MVHYKTKGSVFNLTLFVITNMNYLSKDLSILIPPQRGCDFIRSVEQGIFAFLTSAPLDTFLIIDERNPSNPIGSWIGWCGRKIRIVRVCYGIKFKRSASSNISPRFHAFRIQRQPFLQRDLFLLHVRCCTKNALGHRLTAAN